MISLKDYDNLSLKKDINKLVKELERQGWRVDKDRPHYMAYSPDKVGKVSIPKTPSSQRTLQNKISKLRQHGFEWPPPRKKRSGRE